MTRLYQTVTALFVLSVYWLICSTFLVIDHASNTHLKPLIEQPDKMNLAFNWVFIHRHAFFSIVSIVLFTLTFLCLFRADKTSIVGKSLVVLTGTLSMIITMTCLGFSAYVDISVPKGPLFVVHAESEDIKVGMLRPAVEAILKAGSFEFSYVESESKIYAIRRGKLHSFSKPRNGSLSLIATDEFRLLRGRKYSQVLRPLPENAINLLNFALCSPRLPD